MDCSLYLHFYTIYVVFSRFSFLKRHHSDLKTSPAWMTPRWKYNKLTRYLSFVGLERAYEYFAKCWNVLFCFPLKRLSVFLSGKSSRSNCAKWKQSVLSLSLIQTQPCLKGPVWRSRNSVSLTELCVTSNRLKDGQRAFVLLSWRATAGHSYIKHVSCV